MAGDFPLVRITVLGPTGCGKTALVNSFVNNHMPLYSPETRQPDLYYRVVNLRLEKSAKGSGEGMLQPVCVEIEDAISLEDWGDQGTAFFFDLSKREINAPSKDPVVPFSVWRSPLTTVDAARPRYRPCTARRMGYFLVFDSNSRTSLDSTIVAHQQLVASMAAQGVQVRPIVFLIAAKIDSSPTSKEFTKTLMAAEKYAQSCMLNLRKCSARTGKGIAQIFCDMLRCLVDNKMYWEVEYPENSDEEEGTNEEEEEDEDQEESDADPTSHCTQV